jgi:hypothetical protein
MSFGSSVVGPELRRPTRRSRRHSPTARQKLEVELLEQREVPGNALSVLATLADVTLVGGVNSGLIREGAVPGGGASSRSSQHDGRHTDAAPTGTQGTANRITDTTRVSLVQATAPAAGRPAADGLGADDLGRSLERSLRIVPELGGLFGSDGTPTAANPAKSLSKLLGKGLHSGLATLGENAGSPQAASPAPAAPGTGTPPAPSNPYPALSALNSSDAMLQQLAALPQAGPSVTSTYSLWSGSTTPATVDASDDYAIEVGVKFHADVAGQITGLRFYKGPTNTGTHVGHLWTASGTLLASATFRGETGTGWQQVNFATPVSITANTTYVASYHTNVGHYAEDDWYFTSPVNSGPLHAPSGANGVYKYDRAGGSHFPNQTFDSANYYVDVVFSTSTSPAGPPVANAGPSRVGTVGSPVTFAGSETGGTAPLSYAWAFGDGGTASGSLTPTHTYAAAGTYTATLTVTDALSRSSTSSTTVTVSAAVAPTVTAVTPAPGATGLSLSTIVVVTFSTAMDATTVTTGTVQLRDPSNNLVASIVSYNPATDTATLTPTAALAADSTYTATVLGGASGVKSLAGVAMAANYTWSFTTDAPLSSNVFTLLGFDGTTPPVNGDGNGYPTYYDNQPTEGGIFTTSINTTDSISGHSLQMTLTQGKLYAQFNPYNYAGNPAFAPLERGFARQYADNPGVWQFNTYNRMSFWIKLPTTDTNFTTDGSHNVEFGSYVKQITNVDQYSDETGGDHYYNGLNLPATGTWVHVVLNMHPDHFRGGGSVDPGVVAYPTALGGPNGGDDPANTYNFFDTLTRFYIQEAYTPPSAYPATYLMDDIQFYQETATENDQQVYALAATYKAASNRLVVTWNRAIADDTINQEVRYSFSDIHTTGWAAATPAPNGVVAPLGSGGYNGMLYDNSTLPLAGHSYVYIAIKPQNSSLFTEIKVPLNVG